MPEENVSLGAKVGTISVIIIPIKIANTGAPITSREIFPNFIPPRKVAIPAMTAQIRIPGMDFTVSFIIFPPYKYIMLFNNTL